MLRIRLAICALLLLVGPAYAGIDNAGTTAGNFLSVGTGAAILSMGGATLGGGADLNAAAWNPAALAHMNAPQFALSHATLATESSQDWLAAGGRFGRGTTRWAATVLYQGDGSFDGRDAFGGSTGAFNVSSMAMGLQLARPFGQAFTGGLGAHWLTDNLGDVSGHGLALDAGVQARAGRFGVGAAVRNVGGKMTYASSSYDLPGVYGLGASWSDERSGLRFGLDANFPHAYYQDVRLGGEWRWQDRVAVRAGYRMELGAGAGEPLGGPSFGMGAGANGVWMDYAFLAGNADAQGRHRIGLTFRPGFLNTGLRTDAVQPNTSTPPTTPEVAPAVAVAAPAAPRAASTPQVARVVTPSVVALASHPMASAVVVPQPEPVRLAFALTPPPGGDESEAAPRVTATDPSLAPSRPVRVPHLVRSAPVTTLAVATPAKSAPVARAASVSPPVAIVPSPPAVAAVAPPPAAPAVVAPAPSPIRVAAATPRVVVVTRSADAPSTEPIAKVIAPAERPRFVVVSGGENLYQIAKRWDSSVPAIMMENNLVREDVHAGQKLKLPPPLKK